MKILIFFTYDTSLVDWKNAGFINREAYYYNKLKEDYQIDLLFLTYGDESDEILGKKYFNSEVIPIYKYKKKFKNKYLRFFYSLIFPFYIKNKVKDIDIIKTNQLNGAWVAILTSILLKKPLVVRTGYDIYSFKRKESKNIIKKMFYFYLTKLSLITSKIYFVTSKQDIEFLSKLFPKFIKKIIYLPNWVLDHRINPNKSNTTSIISVGRLEKQKNFHLLLRKFENSTFNLNIVGSGSMENELINISKELNINLSLLGTMDYEQLMDLLNNMKFFISSSEYEGNPKSLLEAMNSGCVVLVNNNENIKEIINHGENGFIFDIHNDNPLDLINSLLNNNEEISKISQQAFISVQINNSLSTVLAKEIETYRTIL